ncbi:MAG: putative transcription regulator [uncultured bacterium]|nr:MAG: putative transcription regulator [uncultured bacterium]KKT76549.1 MAG: putative transcription regulator [Candidatus Peregrinibacteria bacterium GW2011_GWA2_44_7]
MDDFKSKKIRKGLPPSKVPPKPIPVAKEKNTPHHPNVFLKLIQKHFIWTVIAIVMLTLLGKAGWKVITLAEEFSFKEVVLSAFSEKIKTDEENHTNILLLGTGNATHSGANLTDTMIVASIDHDLKWVSMLSIPRDFYVTIPELYGGNRVNSIFELYAEQAMFQENLTEEAAYQKAYEVLAKNISEITGIPIHYYARIDFDAFVEVVDSIEGIDVNIQEDIVDPFYPAEDGTLGYQTFSIKKGPHHLDGKTALKYVRSRKTSSDFARANRQQEVLQAIKEKALSLGVLTNASKLKDLYDAFNSNFDTNLNWSEMVYLAKLASKMGRESVSSWVLSDDPLSAGGFLYTPERELYGGAYVLVPYQSDYKDIRTFADLVLMHPEVHGNALSYQILNGTKVNGLANEVMYYLQRFGFNIVRFGNASEKGIQTTSFIPRSALLAGQPAEEAIDQEELNYLKTNFLPLGTVLTQIPSPYLPTDWTTEADIIIELGEDMAAWVKANAQSFY